MALMTPPLYYVDKIGYAIFPHNDRTKERTISELADSLALQTFFQLVYLQAFACEI